LSLFGFAKNRQPNQIESLNKPREGILAYKTGQAETFANVQAIAKFFEQRRRYNNLYQPDSQSHSFLMFF